MIYVITGAKNSGKTAFAKKLHTALCQAGIEAGGIVSEGEFINGEKRVYHVKSLRTGKRMKLLELNNGPVPDKAGFDFADAVLGKAQNYGVIIIDEFGPLEASGGGYFERVNYLSRNRNLILTARPSLAENITELFAHTKVEINNIDNKTPQELDALAGRITQCLLK